MARPITRHEEYRRLRGYTVTGLADAIDFSHAFVSQVEGGVRKPSARYREAVSKVLRVPEELLFPQVDGMEPVP